MSSVVTPQEPAPATFDAAPPVGHIETDAFCEGCGYSLRGQSVRREPVTQLLMSRCPECGRFAPANQMATAARLWLNRFSTFLLWMWLVFVVLVILVEGLILFGITMGSMDSMIRPYRYSQQFIGQPWDAEDYLFIGFIASLLSGMGFVAGAAAAAAFPHWHGLRRSVFCLGRTALIATFVALFWSLTYSTPASLSDGQWLAIWSPYLLAFVILHGGGGALAAWLGRRPLRLLVRLLLPRRLRPGLSYLWTADGLPPPSVSA
jgi:hypothetical protein